MVTLDSKKCLVIVGWTLCILFILAKFNLATFLNKRSQLQPPTMDDLQGAGSGVLRLQETYNIPIQNLTSQMSDPSAQVAQAVRYYASKLKQLKSKWNGYKHSLPPINFQRQPVFQLFPEYEKLCREGPEKVNGKKAGKLHCYLKRNRPFLKLAPVKVEMLHKDPDIYVFPEAVSEREFEILQSKAAPKLRRSTVANVYIYISHTWQNTGNPNEITTDHRTSKMMDMSRTEETVEILSKRVEDMTDLSLDTAEALKFSEPKDGGGTAFDVINYIVPARKGTAAFWYNVKRNGEPDIRTKHGACPILRGSKWIGNIWIHERGQEFSRPCGLNANDNSPTIV